MTLHESGENYLEAILILTREYGNVRSIDVAGFLGVTKPSVSRAMNILKTNDYIEMRSEGVFLTELGRSVAESMYDRHKVLTDFFVKLGVPEEVAAEDACRMEHIISEETFDCLKKLAESYTDK